MEKSRTTSDVKGKIRNIFLVALFVLWIWSPCQSLEGAWLTSPFQEKMESKTVWDGVYTEGQARSGLMVFNANCEVCHGETARGGGSEGPKLSGADFFENWREDTVWSLYSKIQSTMPRRSPPLSDPEYLLVLAYILEQNNFPSGEVALDSTLLEKIRIEGKDGPKLLPANSLVQTIGCMTSTDRGGWKLVMASNPARNRNPDPDRESTLEELENARRVPVGHLTFDLGNFFMLGDFNPADYSGFKILAKGALISRPSGDRISLTGLDILGPGCDGP